MPITPPLLNVKVYPAGIEPSDTPEDDCIAFGDANYVSFVSSPGGQGEGTYGIPALINGEEVKKEMRECGPVTIIYVNPANIAAMEIERVE